jgi:hypothetical protein
MRHIFIDSRRSVDRRRLVRDRRHPTTKPCAPHNIKSSTERRWGGEPFEGMNRLTNQNSKLSVAEGSH